KKGASNPPPKRNRPGNRNPLRPFGGRRLGLGSGGNGGAAAGLAVGGPRPATMFERRHPRPWGNPTALPVRWLGRRSWPAREDLGKRPGSLAAAARLRSLPARPERIL